VRRTGKSAYKITVPQLGKAHLAAQGPFLSASTDAALAKRLRSPRKRSWKAPGGLDDLFLSKGAGAAALFDLGALSNLFRPHVERERSRSGPTASVCRHSADARRAEKLAKKVRKTMQGASKAWERAERDGLKLATDLLGWLGGAVVATDAGLNLLVEYRQKSSLARAFEKAFDIAVKAEKASRQARDKARKSDRELDRLEDGCRRSR
ncbi:MAG: hypothetical protein QF464_12255, partial [Myxococcota bacterium]|nr:hypothetical protein [Myxococcota bacterium]